MSVHPGAGGQEFISAVLDKIREAARIKRTGSHRFAIEIDGGVKPHNAPQIVEAGAEVLVAGSAVFGSSTTRKRSRRCAEPADGPVYASFPLC